MTEVLKAKVTYEFTKDEQTVGCRAFVKSSDGIELDAVVDALGNPAESLGGSS